MHQTNLGNRDKKPSQFPRIQNHYRIKLVVLFLHSSALVHILAAALSIHPESTPPIIYVCRCAINPLSGREVPHIIFSPGLKQLKSESRTHSTNLSKSGINTLEICENAESYKRRSSSLCLFTVISKVTHSQTSSASAPSRKSKLRIDCPVRIADRRTRSISNSDCRIRIQCFFP